MKPKFIVASMAAMLATQLTGLAFAQSPDPYAEKAEKMDKVDKASNAEKADKASSASAKAATGGDIVQTATSAGMFNTLLKAVGEAGLMDGLKGKGPFTIFAPTDDAFAKLPPGTLDELLKDKAKLSDLLRYHIVPGLVMAKDVKAGKVRMANGKEALVGTTGGVTIDNASVVKADIVASNGVIHVIDNVIMPKT
jgi:uncharacterized surface protein with fasciclin (FAS1) repeats